MSVAYDPKVRTTYTDDVPKLRAAHKLLLEVPFTPSLPDKGYTRRTLFIDLDTMTVTEKPITEEMIDDLHGRARVRPLLPLARHHAADQVERSRQRARHQPGTDRRQPAVRRLGQVARGHPLADDRHPDRLQRRRLLRAVPEVLRLRRARDPRQGEARDDRRHRRPEGRHQDRGSSRRDARQPHRRRTLHPHVRGRAEGLRQRLGRVGGQGRRVGLHGVLEFLLVRPQARGGPPEAGRPRRHGHGLPRQEAQGPGHSQPEDGAEPEQRGRPADGDQGRAEHQPGNPRPRRRAVPHAAAGHGAPRRGDGRLRPAAGPQLPVRQAPGHAEDRFAGVGQAVHAGHPRPLLVRLRHGLLEGGRRPPRPHRPLQGSHRHGGRPRVRERRRPRRRTAACSIRTGSSK